jgi:ferredoxin-type protein NapH
LSFFLFPATFYYLSPALIMEASSKGIINGSFILFSLMFISSILVGRIFCGWICPGAGCQESIFPVRGKEVKQGNYIKWLIWVPWIMTIIYLAVRSGGYNKADFFYQTTYGLSISDVQSLVAYFLVLLVFIVLPAFVFGKRSFCHHLCWMAPFMIIGRKFGNLLKLSILHLKPNPEKCKNCHTCSENCPMSLPVERMVNSMSMENSECILCGRCVDGCRHGALKFHLGK